MPLFPIAVCSGLADRLDAIVRNVNTVSLAAVNAQSPGNMFERIWIDNDYDILYDCMTPAKTFESNLSGTALMAAVPNCSAVVNTFDAHTSRVANVNLDTYLLNSGLQVGEYFAQLYASVRNQGLSAHNVFAEQTILMATNTKSGTGVWIFAQGQNLGTGYPGTYSPQPTLNSGQQHLIAILPSGTSTTNLTMSVSGLDDFGNTVQTSFTFPAGISNAQPQVGTTQKWRSITNVTTSTDDSGAANGCVVQFINRRERIIYIGAGTQAGQQILIT